MKDGEDENARSISAIQASSIDLEPSLTEPIRGNPFGERMRSPKESKLAGHAPVP